MATVEVKSTITRNELAKSLTNTQSVLNLGVKGEHQEEADAQIAYYMKASKCSKSEATDRFNYRIHPATYVFAFKSDLGLKTFSESLAEWWVGQDCRHSRFFPLLPRVIVAGNNVSLVNDGWLNVVNSDQSDHTMAIFETKYRFRWFAFHLMNQVSLRLGIRNFAEKFDYRISDHFPLDAYVNEIASASTAFITAKKR